jgi:hypothetical protein
MKYIRLLIPAALFVFLFAGCYTQLYKPDMERTASPQQASLYNRYDSTAIDTSLRRDTTQYYPGYPEDYGWSYWGRPRLGPIWGFDNYMPDYYWGYYGYNNYYGTPWWYNWYQPNYPYYPGGNGGLAEPPSKRPSGRSHDTGGGSYAPPPPSSSGGATAPVYAPPPSQPSNPPANPPQDDGKRSGGRSR